MTKLPALAFTVILGLSGCASSAGGFCNRYDVEDDGLSEEEFYTQFYGSWDTDNDNRLSAEEFEDAFNREPMRAWGGSFGEWDQNGDGYLSLGEFAAGVEAVGMFDAWDEDEDGQLDDLECDDLDTNAAM